MNKVSDMEGILWEEVFSQLTLVEVKDKQTDGTVQCIRTARKATGRASKTSQIMPEFGIISFY